MVRETIRVKCLVCKQRTNLTRTMVVTVVAQAAAPAVVTVTVQTAAPTAVPMVVPVFLPAVAPMAVRTGEQAAKFVHNAERLEKEKIIQEMSCLNKKGEKWK
jgi:hypothetical protein